VFLFASGRAYRGLDGGRATGDDRPRTRRVGMEWTADGNGFFVSRCKARSRAAEKSWRRTLREDERGAAGLRSDPIHSRMPWAWLALKSEGTRR